MLCVRVRVWGVIVIVVGLVGGDGVRVGVVNEGVRVYMIYYFIIF